MRITNMGLVSLGSSGTAGSCDLEGKHTQKGEDFLAIIYDQTGAQRARVEVPTLTFVDVQPPGEAPYRVRVVLSDATDSLLIDVSGVGADDTVCVVDAPGIAMGTAGVCTAEAAGQRKA